jgi:hypothetical protein
MTNEEWNSLTEDERTQLIDSKPIPESFWVNIWGELDRRQRNGVIASQTLSESFLVRIWGESDRSQRYQLIIRHRLPESFWAPRWKELDSELRTRLVQSQPLPESFWATRWDELSKYARSRISEFQPLSESFWASVWNSLENFQRMTVITNQPIPKSLQDSRLMPVSQRKRLEKMALPDNALRIKRAKRYAKKHGLEIKDGMLLAYRNHSVFGLGMFSNFVYDKKGFLYEDWHCDPRSSELNSFGLGIWPKGNTAVAVPLDKFIVTVASSSKARVLAFSILDKN